LFPLNVVDLVRARFRDLVDSQNKLTFGRRVSASSTMIPHSRLGLRRAEPFFVAAFEAMQSIGSPTRIDRG
jgi:hypothetical protein